MKTYDYYSRSDSWLARHSLGEDSGGYLRVTRRGPTPDEWVGTVLSLRNPRHWLPWAISRITRRVAFLGD